MVEVEVNVIRSTHLLKYYYLNQLKEGDMVVARTPCMKKEKLFKANLGFIL
jgi:hypothetical protein